MDYNLLMSLFFDTEIPYIWLEETPSSWLLSTFDMLLQLLNPLLLFAQEISRVILSFLKSCSALAL